MARSKGRSRPTYQKTKTLSATPMTVARPIGLPKLSRLPSVTLGQYEDRRTYHPEPYTRPAFALPRKAARLVVRKPKNESSVFNAPYTSPPPISVGFAVPDRVAVCVRRKRRKEVIFALNKTGAGAKSKRRRKNAYSNVGC